MRVWTGDPRFWGPGPASGMALSIGVFDGLHRGHQELLSGLASQAAALADLPVGVVTFDVHPRAVLAPDRAPKTLMPVPRRLEVLESMSVDQVGVLPFAEVRHLSPDEFVHRVVVNGFKARLVIVGHDFRYGVGRAGNVTSLRESGERNGFVVEARELLRAGTDPISSSMIRFRIAQGDVAAAADLLGRPHELAAPHGTDRSGRSESGTVTADLDFDPAMAVPPPGAYAVRTVIGTGIHPGLCLVGYRRGPDGQPTPARVHFVDRQPRIRPRDIVTLRFVERVRGPVSGPESSSWALVREGDILRARRLLR
ncbi:MAG: hypothetical protein OXF41_12605 [bacterium]|nr:hypothetical protein [bacterium]